MRILRVYYGWRSRQVDGEDTSSPRQAPRVNPAAIRFGAPSAEGEAETEASAIGTALLECAEQLVRVPARKTAAFVLHLDEHALGAGADSEGDRAARPAELDRVLQDI